jgi:hypothetical protein
VRFVSADRHLYTQTDVYADRHRSQLKVDPAITPSPCGALDEAYGLLQQFEMSNSFIGVQIDIGYATNIWPQSLAQGWNIYVPARYAELKTRSAKSIKDFVFKAWNVCTTATPM